MRIGCMCCFAALLAPLFAPASTEPPRCRVRHPDPDALAARWAERIPETRAAGMFPHAADVRGETQTDVVDILLAFDRSARQWLSDNGKGSPLAYARACVEKMNSCLEQSRMLDRFRFRLAGAVSFDSDMSPAAMDLDSILDRFVDGWGKVVAKGVFKKVTDRRASTGADIVSILVAKGAYGFVGTGFSLEDVPGANLSGNPPRIAEFGDWAYNVCSIQAVDADLTLLHEVGHNMGAGHPDASCGDPKHFSLGPQLFPYSSGYYLWKDGIGYHTVMAYNFGGRNAAGQIDDSARFTPLPYFSSPELFWEGVPAGTPMNDNRRALLEAGPYVACYRASALPVGSTGVTDEANAAAEQKWDGSTAATTESVTASGFTVTGAPRLAKAANGTFPFVGGVYATGRTVGTIQLKVGKTDARKGTCKVGGSVTLLDGKKRALESRTIVVGENPVQLMSLEVNGGGSLSVWLGGNGFAGTLSGTSYGALETRTCALDGMLDGKPPVFALDATAAELERALGVPILASCLPDGEPVEQAAAGKWVCRRAAGIAYRSVRDGETGEKKWMLTGLDDPARPNLAGLRLTCAPRTATFKGSFMVYGDVGTAEKPKLKKIKAAVTGVVVEGEGQGLATFKGAGAWTVTVR